MADVTITAGSVAPSGSTYTKTLVTFGEAVTQGMSVYLKSSDSKYYKAQADGTAEESTVAGIALSSCSTNQLGAILTSGTLTIGGTVVKGTPYYVSTTAGGICPFGDLGSTNYVSLIGFATTTGIISVSLNPTGIQI